MCLEVIEQGKTLVMARIRNTPRFFFEAMVCVAWSVYVGIVGGCGLVCFTRLGVILGQVWQ